MAFDWASAVEDEEEKRREFDWASAQVETPAVAAPEFDWASAEVEVPATPAVPSAEKAPVKSPAQLLWESKPLPRGTDPDQWEESDKARWMGLAPEQKKVFLGEQEARDRFADVSSRRKALRDEEFQPPENWVSLAPEEKTKLQEDFNKTKEVALRGFDTTESEKGNAAAIAKLKEGIVEPVEDVTQAALLDIRDRTRAAIFSPTQGVWDIGAGLLDTLSLGEAKARGVKPDDATLHHIAEAARAGTGELVGPAGDTLIPGLGRAGGTSLAFAPAAMSGGGWAVGLMGAASQFGTGYFEAEKMANEQGREASEGEKIARGVVSSALGATEGLPISNALKFLDKFTGGSIKRLVAIGREGAEEFAQEWGQNTLQDAYDKITGLSNKQWSDILLPLNQAGQAGLAGILMGLFMHGAHSATRDASAVPAGALAGAPGTTVPPVAPPGGVPPVTPPGAVPPAAGVPPVVPPGAAPGAVPPVTVPGAPPVVPPVTPPGAVAPPGAVPPVTPPGAPPVTPPGTAPGAAVAPPVTPPPISPGTAAEVVSDKVESDNAKVSQIADQQAEKLQAAGAPATAEAIKQAADQSNTEASVTAEELMRAAKAKQAAEGITGTAIPAEGAKGAKGAEIPATPATSAEPISPGRVAATPRTSAEHAVVVGGQLFTGETPSIAMNAALDAVGPDAIQAATTGVVDVDNKFLSHDTIEASQELAAAIERGGFDPGAVKGMQAQVQQLTQRDTELNNQIIRPGGEQVIVPGINGQEAVVTARPSQELSQPLAGVKVDMDVVMPDGSPGTVNLPASEALNEARNDRTAYSILLDCLK